MSLEQIYAVHGRRGEGGAETACCCEQDHVTVKMLREDLRLSDVELRCHSRSFGGVGGGGGG